MVSHLASGIGGNMDGMLGDKLIQSGEYDRVRIINLAVGGTQLKWWGSTASPTEYPKRDDDLFTYGENKLFERIQYAQRAAQVHGFKYSHVLIHIGESDAQMGTSTADFKSAFAQLKQDLRALDINAPMFVGRTSYIAGVTVSSIITAQNQIIVEHSDTYAGPNTDTYKSSYRQGDNLHFNAAGLDAVSTDWVDHILTPRDSL